MANKFEIDADCPYIHEVILSANTNKSYGCGWKNKMSVFDTNFNDITPADAYIFPDTNITEIFATSVDGLVFVVYMNPGGTFSLFRTVTDGAGLIGSGNPGFTEVYKFGINDSSAHILSISTMQCGLCEATINGNRVFLVGEYNMRDNSTRVTGVDDLVRILVSYDDGATWQTLVKWNTVRPGYAYPNHQFDHIHAIRYNPYNGWVYICFGDSGADGPAIMAWNPSGTGSWLSNSDFDTQALQDGFYIAHNPQAQRYRYVDLLFTDNYAHGITDTTNVSSGINEADAGIWRFSHDLSTLTRRNACFADADSYDTRFGWTGGVLPSGTIVFTEAYYSRSGIIVTGASKPGSYLQLATALAHNLRDGQNVFVRSLLGSVGGNGFWPITVVDAYTISLTGCVDANAYAGGGIIDRCIGETRVWASSDEGETYKIVGTLGNSVSFESAYYNRTTIQGNNLLIGMQDQTGKNPVFETHTLPCGTAVIHDTGIEFTDEFPTIFHPVYFIDPINGQDLDDSDGWGWTKQRPWQTINFALTNNRMGYGFRLILSEGNHIATASNIGVNNTLNCTGWMGTGKNNFIEGAGILKTNLISFTEGNYLIGYGSSPEENNTSLIIKKMRIKPNPSLTGTCGLWSGWNSMTCVGTTLITEDVWLGDKLINGGTAIVAYANYKFRRTLFTMHLASEALVIEKDTTRINGANYIMDGGNYQIYSDLHSNIDLSHGLHTNYTAIGIRVNGDSLKLKNSIFYNDDAGYAILSVEPQGTDANIDYNVFYGSGVAIDNINNNGGTHRKTTNPLFVDATNSNYHLKSTSPCIEAGGIIPGIHDQATPTTDFDGAIVCFTPNIGPYGQGDIKTITGNYSPTGYSVRGTAESPAKIKLAEHDLNVDLSGLTDAAPYIQVKAGNKRVAGFVGKGANAYIKGSGGSSDGIFGSNFS